MKNLVIVESPTKARTIGKFLGKDYDIKFSMGHIMDLPKSKLGVDIKDDFSPQYEIIPDKKKILSELKTAAKSADSIILATDPDREGEAIASHIKDMLSSNSKIKSQNSRFRRIVFHEITDSAVKEALKSPRDVDSHLVDAQTARRVLDRLVGYQLSPVLWKKVRRGLSAGRVQSVALRLIVEREREIEKFKKEIYFTIHALLLKTTPVIASASEAIPSEIATSSSTPRNDKNVEFELVEINGGLPASRPTAPAGWQAGKIESKETLTLYDGEYTFSKTTIDTQDKAQEIVEDLEGKSFIVSDVLQKQTKRSPYAPFTTSTLQQDAARRFGYPGKRTMSLAQKLYEEGFITYHRTDSTTLSSAAIQGIRSFVEKEYGAKYRPEKPRMYFTKQKNAQEAHEGIRPTRVENGELKVEGSLGKEYGKLYDLIWRRAVASQMADALIESTTVYADARGPVILSTSEGSRKDSSASLQNDTRYRFKTNGSVLLFDGFLRLTPQALEDRKLPKFESGETLSLESLRTENHETTPPPRYNDASLIKTLEEKGIGRPSTYASIISTITDRAYIERVDRRFAPTAVGIAVNDFLVKNFSTIDDIPFTAQMEDNLDDIANGEKKWEDMMKDFYTPFQKKLSEVEKADRVKIAVEETDEECPECKQGKLVIRYGRFGKFFSCSRFPDCKFTRQFVEETNLTCPKDGGLPAGRQGKVIIKKTRKGRKFYGCSNYPACNFAAWKLEDIKKAGEARP